ncbi:MAG: dual specificity protein phosphatase family protein [Myxococcales bacterium]|nr:dual specificity protein phosphatase family protein [Myxococcales bacterium]
MTSPFAGPIDDAYWADPGRLLAGPYPLLGLTEAEQRRRAVEALLDAGVRTVIDLRTPVEPPSVRVLLAKRSDDAAWLGVPILDGTAPSVPTLVAILDAIDASLARDRPVYVHCQGGRGRTGTVVACWWIRHARYDVDAALAALTSRRAGMPHGRWPSPETPPQLRLVRSWAPGR